MEAFTDTLQIVCNGFNHIQARYILRSCFRILAGQLLSGKLGGREVRMSALVSRRLWVRIPHEKFFLTDIRKAPSMQCYMYMYTHVSVGQN